MIEDSAESRNDAPQREGLAIVGIGCRLPGGVTDPESFWDLLASGRSGVVEAPANRWNKERYYHASAEVPGKMITKWGGFLDDLEHFDAKFFGITPREAVRMDPQQRWLLEVAWEALEDAGAVPGKLRGAPLGVFVGIASNDYANIQMRNWAGVDVHTNSGSTLSIASNRIAYLFDLRGPAISVDTACSSALVAINLACHGIWSGQCEGALAGGVNALITPDASIGFSKASMLSPSGRCFAFDARANGYVRGEGAGMVYIKPLSRAIESGDPIYAVIRAAAVNQDGHTSSMTVPGVEGQSAMLRQAYADAGVDPRHVVYMEAHGTGTPVGDPIELAALGGVLGEKREQGEDCLIGSVKTNIGHLESAAGAAGLVKAALVLHKRAVPPSLNFETPNPAIPFEQLRLKVAEELQPLPRHDGTAPVAAVNSFGFGGTNAHVVLQAAPARDDSATAPPAHVERPRLLPISARSERALRDYVAAYRALLAESPASLEDICFSAGAHKECHELRLVAMGADRAELGSRLEAWLHDPDGRPEKPPDKRHDEASGVITGVVSGSPRAEARDPVFVFTGQGAQWWAMGRELLEREPVFGGAIADIDRIFEPLAGWSIAEEMRRPEAQSSINLTDVAQPSIFALQVGLALLWKSWGVEPAKAIGHSVGEVAAAWCAGIYTLEDAVAVIYHRSRLQATTGGNGRMAAVGMSAGDARRALRGRETELQLAVVNSPNLVTLAGDTEALEELVASLSEQGRFVRWLRIDYAFHTHQMEPIRDELLDALASIEPRGSRIPFLSTVTGGALPGQKLDAGYWWRNVREPVLFGPAISNLVRGGENLFVELGPHPALQGAINECLSEQGRSGAVFHSLQRSTDESQELLANLAGLHVHGVPVDWAEVNQSAGNFVRQPAYPWDRERFWLESEESAAYRLAPIVHPLLGLRVAAPRPTWQFDLDTRLLGYLDDHRFWDSVVCPAAVYAEMGLAIARECHPGESYVVEDLAMKQALFVAEGQPPRVQVSYDESDGSFYVHSASGDGSGWELNAAGRLQKLPEALPEPVDLEAIRHRLENYEESYDDHESYYEEYLKAGYQFGPNFRHLQQVWQGPGEALAEIVVPEEVAATLDAYHFHPAVLDACCHTVRGAMDFPEGARSEDYFYLPASMHRIRLYGAHPPDRFWAHCKVSVDDGECVVADIFAYDGQGRPVAELHAFRADRVEQKSDSEDIENCFYRLRWQPCRLAGTGVEGGCEFAGPAEIVAAVRQVLPGVYDSHRVGTYLHTFLPELEGAALALVKNAFLSLGWDYEQGQAFDFEQFVATLGIAPEHHRLARAQLDALAEAGCLRPESDHGYRVTTRLEATDADAHLAALGERFPAFSSEVDLQRLTGARLADVLAGREDPVELLFPGGSSRHLERFYVEGADFPAYNQLIAAAVARAIEGLPARRVLRVLEVGAGTGSLTRAVLGVLPPERTEYVFSDVGQAFVTEARRQFADHPFVEFRRFDVEADLAQQGLEPDGYDIVLATNVLHATSDLRVTLANLEACLAPAGMLMFLEVTRRRLSNDNVFGLLKGWWQYRDVELRPSSALLERPRWQALLREAGFENVVSFVDTPAPGDAIQAVFVATAPPVDASSGEGLAVPEPVPEPAEQAAPDICLILCDRDGVGEKLASALAEAGVRALTARTGSAFARVADHDFTVGEDVAADLGKLLEHAGGPLTAVVHCRALDQPSELSLESLDDAQQSGVLSGLSLIQALAARHLEPAPRVFFVTRGAEAVIAGDPNPGLAAAPLAGLARVANNEHFELRCTLVDLDPAGAAHEIEDLASEVLLDGDEFEIAHRAGRRYASRLHRVQADELPKIRRNAVRPAASTIPYRLQIDNPGILTNLSLNETRRRAPGADEIEVEVRAGGINFRDVMKTLGMYPGKPRDVKWLGDDFSGIVIQVGENVRDLAPGDRVAGMAPYCFRAYVTVDRQLVFAVPERMSFEEAATLPTVFLTAYYAICHLARARAGEKILIHAGTGGVGQAAIQTAAALGLEIFATAGTREKRRMLEDMGVAHAMSSRTLEFADEVLERTGGRGVDVVLNSLSGDFIPKSFSVLAPFGRFLEIGKIDIYKNSRIGLEQLRNNVSYFVIDLAQHLEHKPRFVADMLESLSEKFRSGAYRPLPHSVFPITEAVEAFRYMAQGKHVGKNVLSFDADPIFVGPCTERGALFREDAAYLITGGAGGFGLELAKWMAQNGARHLALMSRSGPSDEAQAEIDELCSRGVSVMDLRGDVTRAGDLDVALARVRAELPPLRGVVHGAMVLDDENIVDLDAERFSRVLRPKMLGAWNLHRATLDLPLEHFICFSSVSAVFGAARQSNYNAGNVFLDALARYRHARGLPALSVSWGALSGAGFVERNQKTMQYLDKLGMKTLDMAEAMRVIERMVPLDPVQIAAARVDWPSVAKLSPAVARSNTFAPVARGKQAGESGGSVKAATLAAAPEDRQPLLESFLAAQVAGVFGMEAAGIERDVQLNELGLDSLMAVELIHRIEGELGMSIPMGSVLGGPSIRELAASLAQLLEESAGPGEAGEGAGAAATVLPLEKAETEASELPLSQGQRALWFLHQLAPRSPAYNLTFSCKFRPLLDLAVLEQAFRALFARHPMLDVTFHMVEGEPVQRVHRGRSIDFREHDATHLSDDELMELLVAHANEPFDLENGPVARLEMFRTADDAHLALLCMHHIVSDAWSVTNMVNDLIEGYFTMKAGRSFEFRALPYGYGDYVQWEQRHLASDAGQRMAAYWRTQLDGAPVVLDLPTDRPRPPVQTFNGATHSLKVDEQLTQRVVSLAAEQNTTLFTLLLSAFDLLLHRYCNQDDLLVGCPLAGRLQPELHGLVGYFVNPVALRSDVGDDPVVLDYLQRNSERVTGALENQHYPLARLVDELAVHRDPSRSPVFQVSFSMERIPGIDDQGVAVFLIGQGGHQFHVGDLSVETIDLTLRQAQFEITLVVEEAAGEIYGCWQYNRDLFDEATIEHLNELYVHVLREITRDPTQRVSELSLMPPDEMRTVLETWNATGTGYPREALLHELIAETAAGNPDATAVMSGTVKMTYRELAARAASVASRLLAEGAGPNRPVALLVERSGAMVVGALGVLQSGSCYVPIDPEFPRGRIAQMLAHAGPLVVLTQRSLRDMVPVGPWTVACMEEIGDDGGAVATDVRADPSALAYVVYTSGSTGEPKGVQVCHRNAVNLLSAMAAEPGLDSSDRLLAVTTLSFDIALLELFGPLLAGGCVVIAAREQVKDARSLKQLIDDFDISVMQATPTTWQMLLDSGWTGKRDLRVLCGGEPLTRVLADGLLERTAEVWNLYGPTETTVWSTCERVARAKGAVSIGRPIANTRVYVLDRRMQPVPAGFVGELYIAGDGVAAGYHGQPELTDARFGDVPLCNGITERLYRTGDLARWTRAGKLECLGRSDFQVKLRGVRIELEEVESQLAAHAGVSQAVVVKRDDAPGGPSLAAYVVTDTGTDDGGLVPALREYLSDRLPESMRPAYYTVLDALPLTPNRKLDRQRLPAPAFDRRTPGSEFVRPQTPSEQALQRIFNEVFDSQEISIRDNFFEMGGDSLQAVSILARVSSVFNRDVPVDVFLRHPTIEQLARYLNQPAGEAAKGASRQSNGDDAAATSGHLTIARSNGADDLPQVDAVALAYIPDTVAAPGLSRSEIVGNWFGREPRVTNVYELPMGRIGVVMLPCFEVELYKDPEGLRAPLVRALELAGRIGAQTVSLTGVIPSVTGHGRNILSWIGDRDDLPVVTTGDATRTATVVKSVEGILAAADRTLESEHLAVVGVGSIGAGALRLMLEVLPHPGEITLYDPFSERAVLERLREDLLCAGYSGSVRILCDVCALPPEVYEASLFVGSTTLPGIVDVAMLPRGALVVDYSFPPMFSVGGAIRRLETSRDILFTTGGQLRMDAEIAETVYLPDHLAQGNGELRRRLGALASRNPREIAGCVLVSLLTGTNGLVRATHGSVRSEDVLDHYRALETLNVVPAQLQMDSYMLKPESIEGFRRTVQGRQVTELGGLQTRLEPVGLEEEPPAGRRNAALRS